MKKIGLVVMVAVAASAMASICSAHGRLPDRWAYRHAQGMSWHTPYYHTATGGPVSLVVPPTSNMQTKWGWGVSQGTMSPIYHQFQRPYHGGAEIGGGELNGTPAWPGRSDHFGVYYIRGPW